MPEFRAAVQEFDDMRTSTEAAAAAARECGANLVQFLLPRAFPFSVSNRKADETFNPH